MEDFNKSIIDQFRQNNGQVSGMFGSMNLLLLTTTGAKSGKKYTNPLAYTKDGEMFVIIASKGGAPTNPDWYYNILKNPEVEVEVGSEKFSAQAIVASDDEREKLYANQASEYPVFNEYKTKTTRQIPVVLLTRK